MPLSAVIMTPLDRAGTELGISLRALVVPVFGATPQLCSRHRLPTKYDVHLRRHYPLFGISWKNRLCPMNLIVGSHNFAIYLSYLPGRAPSAEALSWRRPSIQGPPRSG